MKLFVGTSGYSYPEWRGGFYPADLATKKMLGFYASKLATTELNHTFYKMPTTAQLEASHALVPEGFRFSVKVPASITHRKYPEEAFELMNLLTERLLGLQSKIGCLYFQLPPTLKRDIGRLQGLLRKGTLPLAFELPHSSWHVPEVRDLLAAHDAAFVVVDADPDPDADPVPLEPPRWITAKHLYLRLRRGKYDDATLDRWVQLLRRSECHEAYVYFRHEDGGKGPRFAARFLKRWARSAAPSPAPPASSPTRARRGKPA